MKTGRILATWACGLILAAAVSPAATDVAAEAPIELPKFEVVDSRILPLPESWHYAEIPGFEILSNISERETRRFTQDFILLQQALRVIMPGLNTGRSGVPTALVLTGRSRGFAQFLPTADRDQEFSSNSLFFANAERTAIVIDFALAELQLEDSTRLEADPYRSFYAAYFRHIVRRYLGRSEMPWLEEGLVQLFGGIDFNRKWINFGLIGDGFGGGKVGDFNRLLVHRAIMPLPEMFEGSGQRGPWRAQCYAFVHMCMYGWNRKYQKGFVQFVTRLTHEPLSEALFRECFHASYRDMATELRAYLETTMHTYVTFQGKKGQQLPAPPPVVLRDATQAEVGRIKGEVLRLGGHEEAAHLSMIAPYIRGEKDPRLLAALGLDEVAAGHDDRARRFLEAAAREKAVRPRAYLELARLRYRAIEGEIGATTRLNARQLELLLGPLQTAAAQPPPLPQVYELMNELWNRTDVKPTREQFAALANGVRHFPRSANLVAGAILLGLRGGFTTEAAALADHGTKVFGGDPAQRERFALLAETVARDANATAAKK